MTSHTPHYCTKYLLHPHSTSGQAEAETWNPFSVAFDRKAIRLWAEVSHKILFSVLLAPFFHITLLAFCWSTLRSKPEGYCHWPAVPPVTFISSTLVGLSFELQRCSWSTTNTTLHRHQYENVSERWLLKSEIGVTDRSLAKKYNLKTPCDWPLKFITQFPFLATACSGELLSIVAWHIDCTS